MHKKFSLKVRLILSFLLVAVCVWTLAVFMSWKEVREETGEFFDTYQLLLARSFSVINWENVGAKTQKETNNLINNLANEGDEDDDAIGFAVFDKNGKLVFHDNEKGQHFKYINNTTGFVNQSVHKNDKWRIVWVPSVDGNFIIGVGQEIEFRDEAAMEMVINSLIPWLIGLAVLALFSVLLVSRELRPLKNIEKDLDARSPEDLSPMEIEKQPKEIIPLLIAMNKLFGRIEKMIEHERSFISDSAHELRTPLTALGVQLEVALLSDNDKQRDSALKKLKMGIDRSNRLVEQLLTLSRLETSFANDDDEQFVDWKKLTFDLIEEYDSTIKNKGISIELNGSDEYPIVNGSSILISLLIRNLIDNALRYSPENSTVFININNNQFDIVNSNVNVSSDYLSRLGERFFRPPGQKENGSGLGLSIVKRIASIHNCQVNYENTPTGFKVVVSAKNL